MPIAPPETLSLGAQLRRNWGWIAVGALVALLVAASRFGSVGVAPPSVHARSIGSATASTEITTKLSAAVEHDYRDRYSADVGTRSEILGDIAGSPALGKRIAMATGIPVSRLAIEPPPWADLQRAQQWATGEKRAVQLVSERDPYRIAMSDDPSSPVVDVTAQAPTTATAARLAKAVAPALTRYLASLQAKAGTPALDRYEVTRLTPVRTIPSSKAQLINLAVFTFAAVFLLWCGAVLAVGRVVRDIRAIRAAKVLDPLDRFLS